mmetsp:Transcript_1700/g.3622  ORF Transcript_1700/g.3622 Transcript_1700/m.3622 type:complete len:472 (-) Transcript_1700:149-1564(-)|eukprot:CAMPEP_0172320426 /NCGR_PEP_ID=MMETSP1058-20130122/40570_1 /TAXON_ID=83371 /ORGANISM="Detonula confervacea, Strain CCMP 353" /LENGTH=471 /DNA_ID=CAMNT_0013035695 /DNA_START=74 /DNA_END=1489 /DNA_ORIENTATION=+
MTADPTTTTGILRSRPRYSSAADDGGIKKSDAATSNSSSASADATTATRNNDNQIASDIIGGTARPSNNSPSHKNKTRSLADLVKSSASLSAESSGITNSERGNVISHQQKLSKRQKDVKKFTEGESMSTLRISERGTPYLKEPTDNDVTSGPDVVDADSVLALGVMGEDGQQVRFCEYDDVNNGEINDGNAPTSRDRLEKSTDMVDDSGFDVDEEETNNGNGYDSDGSDGSSGSAQDEEILRELGLSEMTSEANENNAEGDMNMEESEPHANSEELRSFRVLWELLSRWTTPSTSELVLNYQGKCTQPSQQDESSSALGHEQSQSSENYVEEEKSSAESCSRNAVDIGASRRASIISMLKMAIPRSLSELRIMLKGKTQDGMEILDQRKVEQRLADLVRTFDSSAPAANLNMKRWKGLTTILIAIVFPSTGEDLSSDEKMLPPSIRALKMSAAEYRYLTQSAIVSLSSTV